MIILLSWAAYRRDAVIIKNRIVKNTRHIYERPMLYITKKV
jgi:hypothetical protein